MSKNMTRKGLAFGAGAALAVSGLVGMPAQAANVSGITMQPLWGPSDNFTAIQDHEHGMALAVNLNDIGNGSPDDLRVMVELVGTNDLQNWGELNGDVLMTMIRENELGSQSDSFDTTANSNAFKAVEGNAYADGTSLKEVFSPNDMGGTQSFGATSGTVLSTADNDGTGETDADLTLVLPGHSLKTDDVVSLTGVSDFSGDSLSGNWTVKSVAGDSVTFYSNSASNGISLGREFGITSGTVLATANVTDDEADLTLVIPGHNFSVDDEPTVTGVTDNGDAAFDAFDWIIDSVTANTVTLRSKADDAIVDADGDEGAATVTPSATATVTTGAESATLAADASVTLEVTGPATDDENIVHISIEDQELDGTASDYEEVSMRVTAFIDSNGDNVIGETEFASPTRTVRFIPQEDVVVTNTVDFFTVGDATVSGSLDIADVNMENFTNIVDEAGTTTWGATVDNAAQATATPSYVSASDTFAYEFSAANINTADSDSDGEVDSAEYTFDITFDGSNPGNEIDTTPYFRVGAGDGENESKTQVKRTASDSSLFDLEIVAGTSSTIAQNDTGAANDLIDTGETVEALTGTTSISFTIDAFVTDATTRAGSGIDVEVTLQDVADALDTTTLTVEGETLSATTATNQISFTKKTNSNGQIAFTVNADEGADGESFRIDARAGDESIDQTTVQFANRDYNIVRSPDSNFTIAPLGNVTVEHQVVDQFGQAPTGEYQLAFTRARNSGDRTDAKGTTAEWSYVAPVSETGRATVTIVDNGSATVEGVDDVTVALQKQATGGTGYVTESNSSGDTSFTITYETDFEGKSVTAIVNNDGVELADGTDVYPVKLETKTLADFDSRLGDSDPKYSTNYAFSDKTDTTADTALKVSGTVTDSSNDGINGVAVEISAEGLNFADNSASASASLMLNDSIVVTTDASGAFEAFVRSGVSGKQTIDIDAQGATTSVDVTFEGSTGTADSMTLDLASSVVDGRTADVKATVVDAFDNPVAGVTVTFKEEGPGYLNSATGTTDAEGEVIVNLITLSGDTGTSTISATATLDGVSTTESDTITVGTVASAEQKVNAGSFKGFVALYAKGYEGQRMSAIVAGKWLEVESLASNYERVVRFTGAGYDIKVRIYIDGVQVGPEFDITTK